MTLFGRDDSGQAMVEFALVVPLVLLLLFGMLQFALVLDARQTVAYAAQAAANSYAQTLTRGRGDADAASAGAQMRPDFAKAGKVAYTIIRGASESLIATDGVGMVGDLVAARAAYDYPSPIRARLGPFQFPASFSLSAEAVARVEATGSATGTGTAILAVPAPRPAPRPTPRPAPRATAAPTPAPTPIAATVAARCFTFGGANVNVPRGTGRVLIDGSAAPRSFAPGSTHWISAEYAYSVRSGFRRRTVTSWTTGSFTVPTQGTVGRPSSTVASFGASGSAVIRLTGTGGGC